MKKKFNINTSRTSMASILRKGSETYNAHVLRTTGETTDSNDTAASWTAISRLQKLRLQIGKKLERLQNNLQLCPYPPALIDACSVSSTRCNVSSDAYEAESNRTNKCTFSNSIEEIILQHYLMKKICERWKQAHQLRLNIFFVSFRQELRKCLTSTHLHRWRPARINICQKIFITLKKKGKFF